MSVYVARVRRANDEMAAMKKANETEMAAVQAALRKAELHAEGLQKAVEQKVGATSNKSVRKCYLKPAQLINVRL